MKIMYYVHYLKLLSKSLACSMPISVNRVVQDNNEKHIIHTCLPFITFEIFFLQKDKEKLGAKFQN